MSYKVKIEDHWLRCVNFNMFITAIKSAHFTTKEEFAQDFDHLPYAMKAARLLDGEVYKRDEKGEYYKLDLEQ